jgi:hypothetical protein
MASVTDLISKNAAGIDAVSAQVASVEAKVDKLAAPKK